MAEVTDTWKFMLALGSAPRGETTNIIVTGAAGNLDDKLINVTVVTRLVTLSERRRFALVLFVVLPRLFVAVALGMTGSRYLTFSTNQAELILNVVALNFVVLLDEELYTCLVPSRVRTALSNMEPLRITSCMIPSSINEVCICGWCGGQRLSCGDPAILRQALPRPSNTVLC